jgi:hypothetical protein
LMTRAEALLLEAQSLAGRVGAKNIGIAQGLGAVGRHHGNYAQARTLLQQAWRLAAAQQDRWCECYNLSYLAMTELEAGDPAAALPYCQEMAIGPLLATARAEAALEAAQTVDHPGEIALAWAILIQGALGLGDRERAMVLFESLRDRIDRPALSFRARTAVDRAIEQI